MATSKKAALQKEEQISSDVKIEPMSNLNTGEVYRITRFRKTTTSHGDSLWRMSRQTIKSKSLCTCPRDISNCSNPVYQIKNVVKRKTTTMTSICYTKL